MQVEVPMTLTTSPRRMLAPIASQCASNAPTGMGMPADRPSASAHFGDRCPAILSDVFVAAGDLVAHAGEQRVDGGEELLGRQSAPLRVPHPLVAHGADAARDLVGIGDAAQSGRDHVAVFERGDELRAQLGIVAEPVQQLRPSPLGGVDAAAPVDPLEAGAAVEGCAARVISAASPAARWSHQR